MGMRVRNPHHLAAILEHEHVAHLGPRAELAILVLPDREQAVDLVDLQAAEGKAMPRAIADDPRHPRGRAALVDAGGRLELAGSRFAHAGQVVVEYESPKVALVDLAADPGVARAERAVGHVVGGRGPRAAQGLPRPGPVLAMGGYDDPLFAERVKALFPGQATRSARLKPDGMARDVFLDHPFYGA